MSKDIYSGERSPYWDWIHAKSFKKDVTGEYPEPQTANPDGIAVEYVGRGEDIRDNRVRIVQSFVRAFNNLTGRQKRVVNAVEKYKTHTKAAKILGISRQALSKEMVKIKINMSKLVAFNP